MGIDVEEALQMFSLMGNEITALRDEKATLEMLFDGVNEENANLKERITELETMLVREGD